VGGGDLIRDIRGWKGFWYTMEKILIARLLSKQVFLVGVGIAEPTKKWSRFCLKHLLKRCKKIYVRDLRSLNLCQSFDLTNVKLMPDIATVLKSYHTDNYPKVAQTKQKYCLVTFRYDPNVYGGFEIGTKHYINIARALDLLIEQTGMKVIFSPYQEHKDNLIHQELVSYMQHKEACTIKPWNADVMAVFNMASNAELVIAMRLHAIIIGACMKVPCVALPYDYKIDEFCKLAGIKDKIYPEDMLDVGRTLDIIKHSLSHRHNNEYLPGTMWDNASLD
jgi:polysaccharide pyruvyl transferase WcaK-like protein